MTAEPGSKPPQPEPPSVALPDGLLVLQEYKAGQLFREKIRLVHLRVDPLHAPGLVPVIIHLGEIVPQEVEARLLAPLRVYARRPQARQ